MDEQGSRFCINGVENGKSLSASLSASLGASFDKCELGEGPSDAGVEDYLLYPSLNTGRSDIETQTVIATVNQPNEKVGVQSKLKFADSNKS